MKVMKNRNTFSYFVYDLHNAVNIMTGKTLYHKSYNQVRDEFESFRARKKHSHHNNKYEGGCVDQVYTSAVKSKCIVKIVPRQYKLQTFSINKKCLAKKK